MCVYGLSEHRVLSGCLKSVPIDSYIKWQVEIIICFFVFPGYTVDIQASDPLIPWYLGAALGNLGPGPNFCPDRFKPGQIETWRFCCEMLGTHGETDLKMLGTCSNLMGNALKIRVYCWHHLWLLEDMPGAEPKGSVGSMISPKPTSGDSESSVTAAFHRVTLCHMRECPAAYIDLRLSNAKESHITTFSISQISRFFLLQGSCQTQWIYQVFLIILGFITYHITLTWPISSNCPIWGRY